ncbi:unnamed protein product [Linum trigynum]|uniref:Protein kinase domain-containing protein n=1 Tax=Linum trigynum TaxID=586398 RepID=A0AAV2EYC6_9ROSI
MLSLLRLIPLLLLQLATMAAAAAQSEAIGRRGCPTQCGNVTIPFPFGMGPGCYLESRFQILCNQTLNNPPKPFLTKPYLEVLQISVPNNTIQTLFPTLTHCGNQTTRKQRRVTVDLSGGPFVLSHLQNRFSAVGCGNLALMSLRQSAVCGCFSICDRTRDLSEPIRRSCSGIDCCEIKIPSRLQVFNVSFDGTRGRGRKLKLGECKSAYLVDKRWMEDSNSTPDVLGQRKFIPVLLKWMVDKKHYRLIAWPRRTGGGLSDQQQVSTHYCKFSNFTARLLTRKREIFQCSCSNGFQGNPYLNEGCQDIDECEDSHNPCAQQNKVCINLKGSYRCSSYKFPKFLGKQDSRNVILLGVTLGFSLLLPLFGLWWLYKALKRRKKKKLKQKFFKRNGGLLLQKQLSSSGESGVVQKLRLFTSKELEKATNNYNVSRLLGQGAQGTVYKGMLDDGIIVAVKKSMILDGGKLKQFINEVVILSQINHRNVVKLLGCCLETEVPLLVYEFIPNGTLHQFLHSQTEEELVLTWEKRLRIAAEVSGALSYLHSAACMPIYHRDVKSTNILLDAKYRAKVADFGTSRSINIDQTHLTTRVEGTFGYMDPEYYQSSHYTEKSDVYSFGVVLFEMLTRKKPVCSNDSGEVMSHITSFILTPKEDDELLGMIDPQVMKEAKKDDIMVIAKLTKKCLSLTGKDRPTMKEVTMILEGIPKESLGNDIGVEYDKNYMIERQETTCIEHLRFRSNISMLDTS